MTLFFWTDQTLCFLLVPFIVFVIGVIGIVVNRKNILVLLMSIELLFLASNLNFVIFACVTENLMGHIAVLYIITVAGAEASIGLAILISYFRVTGSVSMSRELITRL